MHHCLSLQYNLISSWGHVSSRLTLQVCLLRADLDLLPTRIAPRVETDFSDLSAFFGYGPIALSGRHEIRNLDRVSWLRGDMA